MSKSTAIRNIAVASLLLLPAACAVSAAPYYWETGRIYDACAYSCKADNSGSDWLKVGAAFISLAIVLLWGWLVDRFWKSGESE